VGPGPDLPHRLEQLRSDAENMIDIDDALATGRADEIAQQRLAILDRAAFEIVFDLVQPALARRRLGAGRDDLEAAARPAPPCGATGSSTWGGEIYSAPQRREYPSGT
jgi:hypothetical protein